MKPSSVVLIVSVLSLCGVLLSATVRGEESGLNILQAVLIEPDQKNAEYIDGRDAADPGGEECESFRRPPA